MTSFEWSRSDVILGAEVETLRDRAEEIKSDVEKGYDRIAERYLAWKDPDDETIISSLERLADHLPKNVSVLDLGCGAGVPATRWLSERFDVTGIDISQRQLDLAGENAPNVKFVKSDMTDFDAEPESFDAVVSVLAIIHVPREEQPALFDKIHRWLKPGGYFFGVLSVGEWEGYDPDWQGWGTGMWWSHRDAEANLSMLRAAGFGISSHEEKTDPGGETWLHVLARR